MKNSSLKLELICYIPLVIKKINTETSELLKKKKKTSSTHLKLPAKDDFYKMLPEVLMSMYEY